MAKTVYVGGRMSNPASLARVKKYQKWVRDTGNKLALDWTVLAENGPDEELDRETSQMISEQELSALRSADLVILFVEPSLGVSVEAGIAIERGTPLVIVDCPGQDSIWWHRPNVWRYSLEFFTFLTYWANDLLSTWATDRTQSAGGGGLRLQAVQSAVRQPHQQYQWGLPVHVDPAVPEGRVLLVDPALLRDLYDRFYRALQGDQ